MKIWLLTVGEPTPYGRSDLRLHRAGMLAKTLVKQGHEVTWWSSSFDHFSKSHLATKTVESNWEGGRLVLLHVETSYKKNVSVSRIRHNIQTAEEFRRQIATHDKPDVIVASFPTIELAKAGADCGKQNGIPVLVDVRDLWPDVFTLAAPEPFRPLAKLILWSFYKQARAVLSGATGLIGISEGYLDWGLKFAGRGRTERDIVLSLGYDDTFDPNASVAAEGWLNQQGIDSSKLLVWFVGTFGKSYDLETVIRCARALEEAGDKRFQFVISGDGEARPHLEQLAQGLSSVRFTGWINAEQIRLLQRKASVGLMAYTKSAMQGLPNKLFEYMSAGVPIVSSLEGEGAQFIADNEIGLNYSPQNPDSLGAALRRFADDPAYRQTVSRRCRELFVANYDSKFIYQRYAEYVAHMGTRSETKREASSRKGNERWEPTIS